LVPGLTFISSALPAVWGGKELVFVEVGEDLCIDQNDVLAKVQEGDVIMAVHMGGQVADLSRLRGHRIIEDCAHALGSFEGVHHVGTLAPGCFSFQSTKVLPIGDGGMVTLGPSFDRERAESLSWCGINQSTWERTNTEEYQWAYSVEGPGYKYRANDVMAALALDQWAGLGGILEKKRTIAELYAEELRGLDWLTLPTAREGTSPNWQEYIVRTAFRDELAQHLAQRGIATTVHYYPIHLYKPFMKVETGDVWESRAPLPNTERLWKEILTIPAFAAMTEGEIEQVIHGIRSFQPHAASS
jgi:dTDP-4-amino-4,6-dideoxygalactose transaminase